MTQLSLQGPVAYSAPAMFAHSCLHCIWSLPFVMQKPPACLEARCGNRCTAQYCCGCPLPPFWQQVLHCPVDAEQDAGIPKHKDCTGPCKTVLQSDGVACSPGSRISHDVWRDEPHSKGNQACKWQRARCHQQSSVLQGQWAADLSLVCTCRPTWQQQDVV